MVILQVSILLLSPLSSDPARKIKVSARSPKSESKATSTPELQLRGVASRGLWGSEGSGGGAEGDGGFQTLGASMGMSRL